MDISLTEPDLEFRREVREFLDQHLPTGAEMWTKRDEWFETLRAKGWDVPKWPEEFGGPGWSPTQHYIWDKETADRTMPPVSPFGHVMLAPILMKYGTQEQIDRFLPSIRNNTVNWCQGYSEPGAGSDLANLQCKAVLNEDGTEYTVNGTKIWTTMAHIAQWCFCLTRTDNTGSKQEGITFLLIPMDDVEVKPIFTLGGSHHVNQLFFDNVKVPVENRIGEENAGWTYAKGLLKHERSGIAGISKTLTGIKKLKANAQTVRVGDSTLMEDLGFRNKVAEAEIELRALEFTELRSLAAAAGGNEPGPESSILKLKGSFMQQRLAELTIEAGGIYSSNNSSEKAGPAFAKGGMASYLAGRAATVYGGCSEVQKDVIAKSVFNLK